jgi:hypothetical protein
MALIKWRIVRWGKVLVESCKSYRDADAKLGEMFLRIELCWRKIKGQLEITRKLEDVMDEDDKDIQDRILCLLKTKLEVAIRKFSKFTKPTGISIMKKLMFVLVEDAMGEILEELESWQKRYEPSWFHMIKVGPPSIDEALKQVVKAAPEAAAIQPQIVAKKFREAFHKPSERSLSVFIAERSLKQCRVHTIPFCSATYAERPQGLKHLIIDPVTDGAVQDDDAEAFARRLQDSDPFTFGLLSCKGVVRHSKSPDTSFLFNIPSEYTVVWGLRQLFLSGQTHHSLSDRLSIARQLVTAVYYIHLYGFVHKNIRPETILSLGRSEDCNLPCTAFLVGFQVIRSADGVTFPIADNRWERNLYRHPQRQGTNAAFYVMQHDIYSLGVCLLEIGLWKSFVTYGPHWKALPSAALALSKAQSELENPFALKNHLVALGKSGALRGEMGNKYSELVEICLTCLDEGNLIFDAEEESLGNDAIKVGVRYMEKVLGMMQSISI